MGDFVLIDIWGKLHEPGDPGRGRADAVWYDITWTGVIGREPSERETLIFQHRCVTHATPRSRSSRTPLQTAANIAGWEGDDAARNVIRAAGFGEFFTHRTGHNIATDIHGNGAHLDNLETHDERLILPNTCFSIEPGSTFPVSSACATRST